MARRTLLQVLAVVAAIVLFGFVLVFGKLLAAREEARKRCAQNLGELGAIYVAPYWPRERFPAGPSLFLAWRKSQWPIKEGQEAVLICPADPYARSPESPEERAAYNSVDLSAPPRRLTSYAVRDFARFPLEAGARGSQAIAACTHHDGGALVVFQDGAVRFVAREELGISDDGAVDVGPDSKSALLRPLLLGPTRTK